MSVDGLLLNVPPQTFSRMAMHPTAICFAGMSDGTRQIIPVKY